MNEKSTSAEDQTEGPDLSCPQQPNASPEKTIPTRVFLGVHIWHLSLVCIGILFIASPCFTDGGIIGWFLGTDYEPMPKNPVGFVLGLLQIAAEIFLGLFNCLIGLGFILTAAVGSISAGMGALLVRQVTDANPST